LANFYEVLFTGNLIEADHCRRRRAVLLSDSYTYCLYCIADV